jgi:hypothetical protein
LESDEHKLVFHGISLKLAGAASDHACDGAARVFSCEGLCCAKRLSKGYRAALTGMIKDESFEVLYRPFNLEFAVDLNTDARLDER